MTTADDVLAVAISQLGYREGANNNTKYGAWYGLNNQPWCDMFVSWCFDQAGGADIGGHFAYCPSHVNWFKNRGQWFTTPQRGDVIFYDWNLDGVADHVGLVENVLDGLYPGAIEGNSSDGNTSEGVAVARHSRATKWILGYGRPAYSTSAYRPPINTGTSEEDEMTPDQSKKLDELYAALPLIKDLHTAMSAIGGTGDAERFRPFFRRAAVDGGMDLLKSEGNRGLGAKLDAIKAKLGI